MKKQRLGFFKEQFCPRPKERGFGGDTSTLAGVGKVVVRCPKCKKQLQVARPDSAHPYWSLDKPKEDEDVSNVVEQVLEWKNSEFTSRFTLYWYDK